MAAQTVVTWVVNMGGNFTVQLDAAKKKLQEVGVEAGKAARSLNNNQMLAQFESAASLLTQMGGNIAQVGIVASTAARPLTTLYSVFGFTGIAAAGASVGVLLLGNAMVKGAIAAKGWLDEAAKVRNELVQQGHLSSAAAGDLRTFEQASTRLDLAAKKLKVALADELAPAFTELADAGTGFLRMLDDIDTKGITATGTLSKLQSALTGMGGAGNFIGAQVGLAAGAIKAYGAAGSSNDSKELKYDARGLLYPLLPAPGVFVPETSPAEMKSLGGFIGPAPGALDGILLDRGNKYMAEKGKNSWTPETLAKFKEDWAGVQGNAADAVKSIQQGMDRRDQENARALEQQLEETRRLRELAEKDIEQNQRANEQLAEQWKAQSMGGLAAALGGGGIGGILGAVGGGPIGAIVQALGNKQTPDALIDLKDEVLGIYKNLPSIMGDLVSQVGPEIVKSAPQIAAAFTIIGPATAIAMVEAAPKFFSALEDTLLDLPHAFAKALKEMLPDFFGGGGRKGGSFGGMAAGAGLGFMLGGPLGALGGAVAGSAIKNAKIPFFESGTDGPLLRGGLAVLHAGEEVIPANGRGRGGGGINVGQIVAPNPRAFMREMRELMGSYGVNETLNGFT